jgi:type VI protein secretion system component VasK
MSSQITIVEKKRSRALYPVMGMLLAVAIAVIAYMIAPDVIAWLRTNLRGFQTRGVPPEQLRLMISALIWLVLISCVALAVALFAPRKQLNIKDSDLSKERKDLQEQKRQDRMRQRRINQQMKNIKRG